MYGPLTGGWALPEYDEEDGSKRSAQDGLPSPSKALSQAQAAIGSERGRAAAINGDGIEGISDDPPVSLGICCLARCGDRGLAQRLRSNEATMRGNEFTRHPSRAWPR